MKLMLEVLIFTFIAVVCAVRIGFSAWGLYQILKMKLILIQRKDLVLYSEKL